MSALGDQPGIGLVIILGALGVLFGRQLVASLREKRGKHK
jgi:hypothetical protein